MEIQERIRRMEACLRQADAVLTHLEKALRDYEDAQDAIRALDAYYASPDWLHDWDCDQAGELPEDLPRGVLSEDGIFLLLEREQELLAQMRKLSSSEESAEE